MARALIRILVLVIVGAVAFWLIGMLPFSAFIMEIIRVLVILICLVFLIDTFYPFITGRNAPPPL